MTVAHPYRLATAGVLAAGVVAAGVAYSSGPGSGPPAAAGVSPTALSTVLRQALRATTSVNATLGYAGVYPVAAHGQGTVTWLPAAGEVIREGGVLYRVDNGTPVFLLYGTVPAWRALVPGLTGADVAQLNHALAALGYISAPARWDYFGWATEYGLEKLQAHLGLTVTGALPLGQAVFLPSAIRITTLQASLGSPAGGTVLVGTSTSRTVTIALDAAQQGQVKHGDPVSVILPDGSTTPGVVSSVGTVATSSGGTTTIPVVIRLTDPGAAGTLDQAPVQVSITTASVADALVVPVDALLAEPGGGYAVEEASGARRRLVTVSLGLFDDADGLVQVSGSGLAAGQRVVVPAL